MAQPHKGGPAGQEYVQKQQLHITSRQQGLSSRDEEKRRRGEMQLDINHTQEGIGEVGNSS
jgi:hypothetical protein